MKKRIRKKREPLEEPSREPLHVKVWREALLRIKNDNDSPTSHKTFKRVFPNEPHSHFINVTDKIFHTVHPMIPAIVPNSENLPASAKVQKTAELESRLTSIQTLVALSIFQKAGSYSYRKFVYRALGVILPVLTTVQLFPTEENPEASTTYQFFLQYNLLFSNILFAATTFLTRIFLARAEGIERSVEGFKHNYEDLELYLKASCESGLIDTDDDDHYSLGHDLKRVSYIISLTWHTFSKVTGITDIEAVNRFRISEASTNMIKALMAYLIIAKRSSNNSRREVFDDKFILDLASEFSSQLYTNYQRQNFFEKAASFHMPGHLSFYKIPSFLDFSKGISKITTVTHGWRDDESNQEQRNDNFVANFAGITQLKSNFSTFKLFHTVEGSPDISRLLKTVGKSIQNRIGKETRWYTTLILGSFSALLGGLPFFSYMYEKTDIYGPAVFIVAPLAFSISWILERVVLSLQESEKKYKKLYEEYENKLSKLVDENIINIKEFSAETLKESNIDDNPDFTRCMSIIGQVLILIDSHKYTSKEQVLITLKLFNSFADLMLTKDTLPRENKDHLLAAAICEYIQTKSSSNILGSLYRSSPARKHLRGEIVEDEILSIVQSCKKRHLNDHRQERSSHHISHADSAPARLV